MGKLHVTGKRSFGNNETTPIELVINYPDEFNVSVYDDFEEFKNYEWFRNIYDEEEIDNIEWEYAFTQDFNKHCNGYKIYWLGTFKKLAINRELQIKRHLTIGEAWIFGENID